MAELTGISIVLGCGPREPVAHRTVDTLFSVDSRIKWKDWATSDGCRNIGIPPVSLAVRMYVGSARPQDCIDLFGACCWEKDACPEPNSTIKRITDVSLFMGLP